MAFLKYKYPYAKCTKCRNTLKPKYLKNNCNSYRNNKAANKKCCINSMLTTYGVDTTIRNTILKYCVGMINGNPIYKQSVKSHFYIPIYKDVAGATWLKIKA